MEGMSNATGEGITTTEAAERLGVTPNAVRLAISRGSLRATKIGQRRIVMPADLEEYQRLNPGLRAAWQRRKAKGAPIIRPLPATQLDIHDARARMAREREQKEAIRRIERTVRVLMREHTETQAMLQALAEQVAALAASVPESPVDESSERTAEVG
jgi:excisionase family DNA binding protein